MRINKLIRNILQLSITEDKTTNFAFFNKKTYLFVISILLMAISFAQGGQKWSLAGNNANSNAFIGTTNNQALVFKTNNVENLRIIPNGNVGIGTSSPTAKLDVVGNINVSGNISAQSITFPDSSTQTTAFKLTLDSLRVHLLKVGFGSIYMGGTSQLGNNNIYTDNNNNPDNSLYIQSNTSFNNNTIINYNNTGKVGVGTSSPAHKLVLYSSNTIGPVGSAFRTAHSNCCIKSTDMTSYSLNNSTGILSAAQATTYPTSTGITSMQIVNSTTGTTGIDGLLVTMEGNSCFINNQESAGSLGLFTHGELGLTGENAMHLETTGLFSLQAQVYYAQANSFYFRNSTTGNPDMVIINHNVGINIASPQAKLDVQGNIFATDTIAVGTIHPSDKLDVQGYGRFASSQGYLRIGHDGAHSVIDAYGGSNDGLLIDYYSGKEIYMGTGSTKADVHMGKDLYVCGNIKCDKVTVQTGWCDYVFDKNYNLMPISKVENYVRQHKHLPGVPTEKNIENNGLDVAAATKAQMEKIEDLYLYVMQQQKEITQLKAANKRLQKEIEK